MDKEEEFFYGDLKDVKIIDNFFSPETYARIVDYVDRTYTFVPPEDQSPTHWQPGHKSSGDLGTVSWFWHNQISDIKLFNTDVLEEIKKTLNLDFDLDRVYFNGMNFGQNAQFHFDDTEEDMFTFLSYVLPVYDMEWGGQTVFVDGYKRDLSILPVPNRAVIFPSRIVHKAQPFSDATAPMRVSLAYKLKLIK